MATVHSAFGSTHQGWGKKKKNLFAYELIVAFSVISKKKGVKPTLHVKHQQI